MIIRPLLAAALVLASGAAVQAQDAQGVSCVSCLILEVPAAAAGGVDLPAGALDGLDVAVRGDDPRAADARARLAAAGARLGIELLEPTAGLHGDAQLFAARTEATRRRAATPAPVLAVDPAAFAAAGVPIERLRPYVDFLVTRVVLPTPLTVEALVDASLTPGGDRVWATADAIDWPAVVAFVAGRAALVDVRGTRGPTAGEIVARHQAQRRRQESLVAATIARGTSSLLFEVPGFVAPVTITARTTTYTRGAVSEHEQQDVRVNGAPIAGGSADAAPQLPLLEPERLAAPPLAITLSEIYRYRLEGTERVGGADTYVIGFDAPPGTPGRARGRAWIDSTTYALRRLQVLQDAARGPIVSSEQVQEFAPVIAGGHTVMLPARTRVFQMYEGAGHRTPIHRRIAIDAYEVNPADFDEQLRAAYASSNVMLREGPDGLRYLLRARGGAAGARVAAGRGATTIRTVVAGLLVDPNISDPLPFAGLSYVDLDLFGSGAQLNAFFGGTYGQLSWSLPPAPGRRWRLQGSAFAIAARYNDRAFSGGVERYAENIRQRPARLTFGVVRPLGQRLRGRLEYALEITSFSAAETTAATFRVPATAVVHGLVAVLETERGPWTLRGWWSPARRQGWRAWGRAGEYDPATRDFQRLGATIARTLALRPTVGARVEATITGGSDLDRFSRTTIDSFENRLHGYPTASLRYDRGAIGRSAVSWNRRGWRLDGFADLAVVRDPGFGDRLRGYPGVGVALETAAPFRTLLAVEWGYGFKGPRRDGGVGTQAVRITAYRMF